MANLYTLDASGQPIREPDLIRWGVWYASADRHAADDAVTVPGVGVVRVSTVFLAADHAFGGGPPVLWETMIFGGDRDGDQRRYTSRAGALAGHAEWLAEVKEAAS